MNIFRISVLIATGAVWAPSTSAESPLAMTKAMAPLLAKAGPDDEGTGLLMLSLDVHTRSWGRKQPLTEFKLELTNSRNQRVHQVELSGTATQLVRLSGGRYCITAIRTADRTSSTDCSTPFVDVHRNSVSWSGNVVADVSGRSLKIMDRNHDLTPETIQLSPEDQQRLSDATEAAQRIGYRTFFLASPGQLPRVIRLTPHGQASIESFTVASPSIDSSEWSESGSDLLVDFEDGAGWTLLPAGQLASQKRISRITVDDRIFAHANTLWFAQSIDPTCWHWKSCGQRFRNPVQWEADYTETDNFHRISGSIRVRFRLKAKGEEWVPDEVSILDSGVAPEHHSGVSETFASTTFIKDLVPMRNGFAEATIQFAPDAEGLKTTLKIESVPTTPGTDVP